MGSTRRRRGSGAARPASRPRRGRSGRRSAAPGPSTRPGAAGSRNSGSRPGPRPPPAGPDRAPPRSRARRREQGQPEDRGRQRRIDPGLGRSLGRPPRGDRPGPPGQAAEVEPAASGGRRRSLGRVLGRRSTSAIDRARAISPGSSSRAGATGTRVVPSDQPSERALRGRAGRRSRRRAPGRRPRGARQAPRRAAQVGAIAAQAVEVGEAPDEVGRGLGRSRPSRSRKVLGSTAPPSLRRAFGGLDRLGEQPGPGARRGPALVPLLLDPEADPPGRPGRLAELGDDPGQRRLALVRLGVEGREPVEDPAMELDPGEVGLLVAGPLAGRAAADRQQEQGQVARATATSRPASVRVGDDPRSTRRSSRLTP